MRLEVAGRAERRGPRRDARSECRSGRLAIVNSSEQVRIAPRTGCVVTTSKVTPASTTKVIAAAIAIERVRDIASDPKVTAIDRVPRSDSLIATDCLELTSSSFLEVIAQPVDDRVGLGLGEDLLDDGLDAARAPLAALAKIGLGPLAEDVRRRRGGGGLGQAERRVASAVSGAARPPVRIVTPASDDLMPLATSRLTTPTAPMAPRASIMSRTRLAAVRRVSGMP